MADRTPVRHSHSLISFQSFYGERLLQQGSQPFFGSWCAPMFASAHTDVVQGHNNGEHLAMSPKSLLQPLGQVILSAEEKLKKRSLEEVGLREEIVKMALKQVSTSKALKELMGFQTQARLKKEKMEAKINEMEEDLKKEKTRWSDLSCQWLEEISSLGTELSVFQSHNQHLKEENARVTLKQVSTSEALEELMGLQTQANEEKEAMEAKISEMEEDCKKEKTRWWDLRCQWLEEISSLGTKLSVFQSHNQHLKEENARVTLKQVSTSEALEQLMGFQTQAREEKEEIKARINKIEEDFIKDRTSLRMELSVAQSYIDHLEEDNLRGRLKQFITSESLEELMSLQSQAKTEREEMEAKINELEEENARVTMKDDSTSEALEVLMGIQTQANEDKEGMEAKINEMEEDFNKEKTTWSDLSCQRLEEISSLGTELSVAQSHIDHLKEENAKMTMKDDSTSEDLEELMGLQSQAKTEMEAKVNQMEEDFNKEKTTWSDLSCQRLEEISSLGTELSVAQSHIDHLKEENAKLTMKDDSTSEDLEELMGLQTQAKTEKEEMDAKINQMEEDFNKEKIKWSDLSCQRLEEISSLGTELLVAQSHIDHLNEENAKLTMKDDSTSEAFEELMGLQTLAKTEMEAKVNQMEEDFNKVKTTWSDLSCQRLEEISSLGTELSDAQSHIDHLKEENAKLTIKDDITSEAFKELMGLQTQAKMEKEEMVAKINEVEEDLKKEKISFRTELSVAQSHIDHLKEENAKLTMKDDSTSEDLEELMGLQSQAKMEMEAKVNQMEEDFNKAKTTWSDLSCQWLEEISSFGTELSDAQSHIDHLKEENAKLTIKDDSTSEAFEELMGLQTQAKMEKEEMEAKINDIEEDFKKEKTSLRTELSDAQSHIDHLKEENAKLTMKDDSTSEDLEELMGLQTQAKTEKEEMDAKINQMEEDFNKEKITWLDLSCQRLEEISSLGTELSVAQSHIDHLKEENAKLKMKDDSTSEFFEELMGLQTKAKTEKEEMEAKVNQMEEDFNKEKITWSDLSCQRLEEISSLGTELSVAQSHIDHLKEENAKLTMKDDSTSEDLEELMGLQTLAKTEMEAKINQMEEDFNKEKTTWSDLSCQRLEEMSSLGTELSDAQSHIDHLKEENSKLMIKDDSTSEAFEEIMFLQTQAKMEKEEMVAKLNEVEEDLTKEKLSLRTELSVAQSHIDNLKEENAKLTIKDDSTSKDLEELMGLQTQAKTEKEEMEAKINHMEEDFNKEKTTWSDLSCQRLEEISSLGMDLSDSQSHIDHLKEENARLTIKDDSTSEAFKELMGLQTQAKMEKEEMVAKINEVEEDLKKEKISFRTELSVAQSHIDHLKEENAKMTIKDDSTSEAFEELMGLQTQAKMEKEEMEAKINDIEEDFKKEKTSLRTELSDAQSHIDHLKKENAKLKMKDDSTSEFFEELMGLQTKAKTEKEEMEAKVNQMEEDFNKEKITWSDLSCQRLEEISSLGTELSVAQSHIDHLKEENAKLTMKDDSTSEDLEELMGLQTLAKTEMEAKVNQMEEDFNKEKTTWSNLSCQRLEEMSSLGTELSDAQSHIDHLKEENAKLMIKDDSTSEAFEEIMFLQTQAKMEKEEMVAKLNEVEEDLTKEKLSLRTELSVAQSHIDNLKEENAKLTIKDDSTSKDLEELMGLQTQAKTEKEEMEAKINHMEEDFNKEKTTWSDLSCQRLEEISSLGMDLSDSQSHIDHLKEENSKLTMKDDSTSEAFEELMGLQTLAKTEMEAKVNQMEEDFNKEKTTWSDLSCQRLEEISSLGTELSDAQSHIDHLKEENAKLTIKDDSTSEAFEEIMFLQTQAKMEKEEMVEKLNEVEEDLTKEKISLRTELSVAQSHIDYLKEENARLTIKDDSTSEAFKELMGLQTQAKMEKEEMEAKINYIEEDFKKEKTSLRTELSDAQSHIDHLKEENAKLKMKDDSTSEAFEELMGLQTQAKTEKEEMEAKVNQMEEDFNKEKITWSDLSCQRLEELSSLGTELSVAQSHIDHLKEENAKLTMKADSTSEDLEELMGLQTQAKTEMEAKVNQMEEDFNKEKRTWSDLSCQRLEEMSSLGTELLVAQSHIDHLNEENAKLTMKDDGTSKDLEELMGLQTLAKMEKEEMEAKLNELEEDLTKEKKSFRTELSVAQSHIDHLKEENAKLTMKDDNTSEDLEELMGLQTQAKMEKEEMVAKINEVEEDLKKENISFRTELSVAQSHIDHLKEENAKLTMKDDSTSEDLEELMGLQNQAKMEMEEMVAEINQMEEDFNKEKITWSDLSCQRLEEISSLGTELLVAQSHIDHLKEENARLTIKDDSTSEAFKELMGLQTLAKTEMEAKVNHMEEDFNEDKTTWSDLSCQRLEEISRLGTDLSDSQSHIAHLKEENSKLTIKDDSTSEAFEELKGIQTQVKMEKEEMVAKINEIEEDFNKEKTILRTELSDAQLHIDHLKEENAKLTMKADSTSENLEELMGLQTLAKMEMETKVNQMEEDFNKEKTTWSDLSCQRLEEISILGTELSDAQSHMDHLKEQNAKLTIKDDSTSEAFEEIMFLQTQVKMEKEEMVAKLNEVEEDLTKEKISLRTELSVAQSHIDHLKEENAKLTIKDDSTSKDLEELMGLQYQAKTEKEEMEAKVNQMEEDFNKEKTTWSDLSCQRLEEISSLGTELSVAQSHIDQLKEENAKLMIKDESTSEAFKEIKGIQTQAKMEKEEMEAKINYIEEDFKKEKTSLRTELSDAQSRIDHLKEENAKLMLKDDSTSENLEELMGLQTQAKTEKEEMDAKINQMEEDFNKEKITWSDLSCQRLEKISSLGTELLVAQSHIDHLKEENAKLTMKDDSTSEDFKELMGLQTLAKTEMEAKVNQMEEDFNKEKTTWSDLSCQRLEEISILLTELSDAQSHINHLKEENAKLTIKEDSTSEAFEELKGIQTQAKMEKEEMVARVNEIEEDFNKEKTSLRTELSDVQLHIDHLKEENAKLTMKDDSTSENLEELMGLQTLAKTEMEAKVNQMEEDFNKEKTTWSDLSCQRLEEISSLGTELSVAQSHIDHLKEENAKLTMKDDSTSEDLEELIGLQTQAKTEKEEMDAKIYQMEEDFNKEKITWSDLSCQRLEEISSLGTELLVAQSHIDHLKEENAKLTMKDDSTSEAFEEIMFLQTQAKMEKEEMVAKLNEVEVDLTKEKISLRTELSVAQSHNDHLKEENAKLTMKDDSTSEDLEELMGLQTQAKMEKEEMEAKINDIEEDFKKEKTSLRTELSDAQSHIDSLKEENAKLTMKDDSTSEDLEELMGLQTQAKTEKEEMDAKINQMEEDFNKEKITWSDLSCQRLEEISSLGTELLVAQSHIDHLKEENAKLTMKDDSTLKPSES
ncbi:hypothetical protein NQZ68_003153 [Dissostichus eleginoides]|nr:hypothetical protein NQZ68_003153 [Dissostichus eleginoides]